VFWRETLKRQTQLKENKFDYEVATVRNKSTQSFSEKGALPNQVNIERPDIMADMDKQITTTNRFLTESDNISKAWSSVDRILVGLVGTIM
jgi:hypothetical protein